MNPVFEAAKYQGSALEGFDTAHCRGRRCYLLRARLEGERQRGLQHSRLFWPQHLLGLQLRGRRPGSATGCPRPIKSWVTPPNPNTPRLHTGQGPRRTYPSHTPRFGEDKTKVIQLKPLQVNLLADLAAWSISNKAAVDAILSAFDKDLPAACRRRRGRAATCRGSGTAAPRAASYRMWGSRKHESCNVRFRCALYRRRLRHVGPAPSRSINARITRSS